jgi:hypothetical protein
VTLAFTSLKMPHTLSEPRFIFLTYALTEAAEALRALKEVRRLSHVSEERQPGVVAREWRSIIRELRAALTASANVSKVFWPPRAGVPATRAADLRLLCNLPDAHGLRSRELRNHIEHIDERLDEWLADGPRPFLTIELVHHIAPDWPADKRAESAAACMLVYDAAKDVVTFLGHVFSLAELEKEITEVQGHLTYGIGEIIKDWPTVAG